jgi:carbon-monoxide dehydrogenase medium subunit
MKARNFAYARPATLAEALELLEHHGEGAVPLAGGQSLLATLNMRLSSPEILVDIGNITELNAISVAGDEVSIGALTTHVEILESPVVKQHLPLLSEAIRHVAHVAIRNRGTIGGSLAYADPAAELPACTLALGGTLVLASRRGKRKVSADRFFKGLFETDLKAGELIVEIRFPIQRSNQRWVFFELSRRRGDFAIAGIAIVATLSGTRVADSRVVYLGCVDKPTLAGAVSTGLVGKSLPLADFDWIDAAIRADLTPLDSAGWKASTKLQLATVLTRRALHTMNV